MTEKEKEKKEEPKPTDEEKRLAWEKLGWYFPDPRRNRLP